MSTARQSRVTNHGNPSPSVVQEIVQVALDDIREYHRNPRLNDKAVPAVMESIVQFGFWIPVILDNDNTLVAGHTRCKAARRLGMVSVPAVYADHLTEEQIAAFRIADNKVAEGADWDTMMLAEEMAPLIEGGFVMENLGFTREEIDCLGALVEDECMASESLTNLAQAAAAPIHAESHRPDNTRYVVGEFVFHTTTEAYREWHSELFAEFEGDQLLIARELKRRLGLPIE